MKDSMVIILWPVLVLVLGALVYGFASNPKLSEMGRIAYFVGLLWAVYDLAPRVVRF